MIRRAMFLGVLLVPGMHASVFGEVIHVPGDQPSIQAAIDVAADGDRIIVAPGTYFENINLLGKAVTLRSSAGPEVTTIDANGSGTVVLCDTDEGPNTVIDGFTITGGSASTGGGMKLQGSSPTVSNCTFSGNAADLGGGMYNLFSSPTVTKCAFRLNQAGSFGGGMYASGSCATVSNCAFSGNTATLGGGLANFLDCNLVVSNCTFNGNLASDAGGGVFSAASNPQVTNCMFSGNTATSGGGGIWLDGSGSVTNCTFGGNIAPSGGGIRIASYSSPAVTSCIVWNNNPNEIVSAGTPFITFSDVQDGWPGVGNIDADPLFIDTDGPDDDPATSDDNDYRLAIDSACIEGGNNVAVPDDVVTDLDGNPRIVDGDEDGVATVDMGAYEFQISSCVADIDGDGAVGAEDLAQLLGSWGPCAGCPADFNGDGVVGAADLAVLLGAWGPCP